MKNTYFTALTVAASVLLFCTFMQWMHLLYPIELKTLDQRIRWFANTKDASKNLVLVTIDEASLATYGRWPWPRDRHAYVLDYLKRAGAKAVVFDVLFLEPDRESPEFDDVFARYIERSENVVLPFILTAEAPVQVDQVDARRQGKFRVEQRDARLSLPSRIVQFPGARFPIQSLLSHATRIGFINIFADVDGTVRRVPPVARVAEQTFPHLGVAAARAIDPENKLILLPDGMSYGGKQLPLSEDSRLLINWHGSYEQGIYPTYPIGAVLQSYVDQVEMRSPLLSPDLFKDKIVFIAATAAGLYDLRVTPLSPITPGVMIHMAVLDNMLQGNFLRQNTDAITYLSLLLMVVATSFSYVCVERWWLKLSGVIALGLSYVLIALFTFVYFDLWLVIIIPMLGWSLTCVSAATVAFFTEGKERRLLRSVFDRYMAAEVVDEILRNPAQVKLGGEKQQVTLFFSDVAGFTTLSENLQPDILVDMLNEYLSLMTDIIMQYRGNVNKYLGDGIMAFFGAPRYEPDHASLACRAALECQRQLKQLQASWSAQGYPNVSTRIGLNTGQVVLGNVGSPTRMEYTAMGDSVNLASRLEGANKFYGTQILMSMHTYHMAQHDIVAREIDTLRVKGKQQPVVVYELLATTKDVAIEQKRLLPLFTQGLRCYKARDFLSAQTFFEAALDINPNDGPSRIYFKRSQAYDRNPPPGNWDGVYELNSK